MRKITLFTAIVLLFCAALLGYSTAGSQPEMVEAETTQLPIVGFGNAESGIAVGSGLNHKAERGQGESGHQNEAGLAARRVSQVNIVTCAAPAYLQDHARAERSPRRLRVHERELEEILVDRA